MKPWISKLSKWLGVLIPCPWTLWSLPFHLNFPKYSWRELSETTSKVWRKGFKTLKWTHPTLTLTQLYQMITISQIYNWAFFSKQSESIKAMCPERNHPSLPADPVRAVLCPVFPAQDELDSWSFPSSTSPSNGVSGIYKMLWYHLPFLPIRKQGMFPQASGIWRLRLSMPEH